MKINLERKNDSNTRYILGIRQMYKYIKLFYQQSSILILFKISTAFTFYLFFFLAATVKLITMFNDQIIICEIHSICYTYDVTD